MFKTDSRPPQQPVEPRYVETEQDKIIKTDNEIRLRIEQGDISNVSELTEMGPGSAQKVLDTLVAQVWPVERERAVNELKATRKRIAALLTSEADVMKFSSAGRFMDTATIEKMLEPLTPDHHKFTGSIFLHALVAVNDDVAKVIGPVTANIQFRDLQEPLSEKACEYFGMGSGSLRLGDLRSQDHSDHAIALLARRSGEINCVDRRLKQRIDQARVVKSTEEQS